VGEGLHLGERGGLPRVEGLVEREQVVEHGRPYTGSTDVAKGRVVAVAG
jgi:hypothetical protein